MNRLIGITFGLVLAAGPAQAMDLGMCEIFEEPIGKVASMCDEKQQRSGSALLVEWNTLGLRPDRHGLMADAGFAIDFAFDLDQDPAADGALTVARIKPTRASLDPAGLPRAIDDSSQWLQVVVLTEEGSAELALRHFVERAAGIELAAEARGVPLAVAGVRQKLQLQVERRSGQVQLAVSDASGAQLSLTLDGFGELLPWIQLRGPTAPETGAISNSSYSNPRAWAH